MTTKKFCILLSTLLMVFFMTSCEKDDDMAQMGTAKFEITDAPIDQANIKSAFVTVADIKVDGESLEGFNKTTIDLLAYQNGESKLLTNSELEAKSYNEITLVLDYEQDENGNSPGCYVEEMDGSTKHPLQSGSNEISMMHEFAVESDQQTDLVMDFDLRKCVKAENNGGDDKFEFVTNAEMKQGIRIVNEDNTGVIKGNCSDLSSNSDKIVVFAYEKGSYDRDTELQGQGSSNIRFAKAVSSASLDANGDYELHFLKEGDYEIHFASYEEMSNGEMQLKGTLMLNVVDLLDLTDISLDASASVSVNVIVTGLLPI